MNIKHQMKPSVLAVIPARGGSKGIPRKNLIDFNGMPLIASSIHHAKDCCMIDRILVSTDDLDIQKIALSYGAEAPFLRPKELSEDQVLDFPVFKHALDFLLDNEGYKPDIVVHLRPTAPYRVKGWIDNAIHMLIDDDQADSVRSVSEPDKHPYRIFSIGSDGYLDPIMKHLDPKPYLLRRQDLPPMYYYNCVIDVTRSKTIYEMQSMTGNNILPLVLDPNEVIDIDTPRDLQIAKYLFEGRQ